VGSLLEERILRQVKDLPADARTLLLEAAEPSGGRALLWRAAARLGLDGEAAVPAEAGRLPHHRSHHGRPPGLSLPAGGGVGVAEAGLIRSPSAASRRTTRRRPCSSSAFLRLPPVLGWFTLVWMRRREYL